MLSRQDFTAAFHRLDLPPGRPVIVHASLSAFGPVQGGAAAVVDALLEAYPVLLAPVFTYKTMLTPEVGPPENGLLYGSQPDQNLMAQFFHPDLPADRLMGIIPETLRRLPQAERSSHPIQSFAGVNASEYLQAQGLAEPLAPLRLLAEANGWALLMGVDQTVNTSIHVGERLAGRKQFVRWALTPQAVVTCPGFPGCSDGFQAIEPHLQTVRRVMVGPAFIQAVLLPEVVQTVHDRVRSDPLALLCDRPYCDRCDAVRHGLQGDTGSTI